MIDYNGRSSHKFYNKELPDLITSQRQYELDELIKIYQEVAPSNVIEIGTQDGGTLYQWIKHAQPGTAIINIDILEKQPDHDSLIKKWHKWKTDRGDISLVSLIGRSQDKDIIFDAKRRCPNGVDFLFIDGDHTYEGAKADFETYGPMVNPGGVIVFHDLMTPLNGIQDHIQVGKLWREVQHAGYVTREIWASEYPDWGGIGVVYVQAQSDLSRDQVCERQRSDAKVRSNGQSGRVPDMRQEEARTGEAPV